MRSFNAVWRLEWRRAVRRGRLFRLNVVIPLLLVTPIALARAPAAHACAVYTVLFALFGTFGAAIPALRDAESGLLRRVLLLPLHARSVVLARAFANACVDAVQLLPCLAVILIATSPPPGTAVLLVIVLAVTLALANLAGLLVAAVSRSVGEGALFAAVGTLLLLHASGVFRTPAAGSIGARLELVAPYRALHELLLAAHALPTDGITGVWYLLVGVAVLVVVLPGSVLPGMVRADGST